MFTVLILINLLLLPFSTHAASPCPFHIMSGDVSPHRAIIQASLSHPSCRPNPTAFTVRARIIVSLHRDMSAPFVVRNLTATPHHGVDPRTFPGNYVIKAFLSKLKPNTVYYYRFTDAFGRLSPKGSFRTLQVAFRSQKLNFIHMSCANINPYPIANAIARHVRRTRPNFAIFNGDTVYADRYWLPTDENYTNINRCCATPQPTLPYFRSLFADQRDNSYAGVGFPAVMRSLPVFTVWDDHLVADNFAGRDERPVAIDDDLPAGTPIEKTYTVPPRQMEAFFLYARQAFFEMNGVTPGAHIHRRDRVPGVKRVESRLFRKFRAGRDVEVFILDLRQYRDEPVISNSTIPVRPAGVSKDFLCSADGIPIFCAFLPGGVENQPGYRGGRKTMMGQAQKSWIKKSLKESTAKFKIIISSVSMLETFVLPADRWEGYWKERKEFLSFIEDSKIQNVIFLVGDIHASIFSRVNPRRQPPIYEFTTGPVGGGTLAVDLGVLTDAYVDFVVKYAANGHLLPVSDGPVVKFISTRESNFMSVSVNKGRLRVKTIGTDGNVIVDSFGNRGELTLP